MPLMFKVSQLFKNNLISYNVAINHKRMQMKYIYKKEYVYVVYMYKADIKFLEKLCIKTKKKKLRIKQETFYKV